MEGISSTAGKGQNTCGHWAKTRAGHWESPSHEGDSGIGQAKPGVSALISQVEHTTPTAAGLSWSVEALGLPSGRQGHGDGQIKLGVKALSPGGE